MTFSQDPLHNIVNQGIREPIRLLLENRHFTAALTLVYCGIDAMAFLGLPADQDEVRRPDFISWCDRYLVLPGDAAPTGIELFGARCGALHTHSGTSGFSRRGEARLIQYANRCEPPVMAPPDEKVQIVLVSLEHLVDTFFEGIDRHLVALFSDAEKASVAEGRLPNMFVERPIEVASEDPSASD